MSEPVSPLGNPVADGFATVREIGPLGMITLRAKAGTPGLDRAVKAAAGTKVPSQRAILTAGDRSAAWMSPDEFLLVMPRDQVPPALDAIVKALAGQHHLAVDVSDARAVFRIEGPQAADVLRKLTPADLGRIEPGEVRRSRLAQIAAAFWAEDGGWTVVTFRSVARYAFDLMANAARTGSELP
jgi:sarcosine oxidase, subunit gamma